MKSVYISGPLHAVENLRDMREFYELLACACRECGFDPYLPHTKTDPLAHKDLSSRLVFEHDMMALSSAAIVVAYIGKPSSGVGAELGLAIGGHQKIIALFDHEDSPSRFLLGMLESHPRCTIIRYAGRESCLDALGRTLRALR